MRKILFFAVIIVAGFIVYSALSDPQKREKIFSTIEDSTGVEISKDSKRIIKENGSAIGESTGRLIDELGSIVSEPEFQQSLKQFGEGALEKLDEGN